MAAGDVLTRRETSILFADAAQTPDNVLTLASLASGACRTSAQHDLGAGPRADEYQVRATIVTTGSAVGETIDIYISEEDESAQENDGQVSGDILLPDLDKLNNCKFVGSVVQEVAGSGRMCASFIARIVSQKFIVLVHNRTGAAFSADDSLSRVRVAALVPQGQTS